MRQARIKGEGLSYYHCVSRIVDRRFIFGDAEKEHFVALMRKLEGFLGLRVVTYVVMCNHFHLLVDAPDKDGLQWVAASPKSRDGQLQSVRVGFRVGVKVADLAVLEILDSFGQRSVLTFSAFQANASLDANSFEFRPPPKADVIRQ